MSTTTIITISILLGGLFVWLGLPMLVRTLGLHPHYSGPVY